MSTIQTWSRVMLALIMMTGGAFGQAASDPGEGLRAVPSEVAGVTAVKWWGKLGRSYFVQSSETLLPGSWQYMPVVEDGADGVCTYNLQTSAERMFVRLVYTDQAHTGGAAAADFDGDGIANHLEVSSSVGLNPLDALQDEDGDGMPDAWEMQNQLSRFDGSDGGENGPMPAMPVAPPVPVVPNPQSFYFPDSMGVLIWNQTAYDAALENYDLEMAAYPDAAAVFLNMWNLWSAARLRHDPDNDGLSNVREYHAGSDPWVADTDGDGFHDGVEVEHGSLPALASSTPPFRLDVISGNLQEIIAGTSSSEVLLLASRAGQPLAGKAVRFESGSATLLLQPVGGGSAGAIVTMTTNAQGQVAVTLQAPASPALGLVSLAAELTEHAGAAAGFQAAVVEPGLSFLRPDVWAWLSGSGGGSSSSPGGMQTFVPGATAVVLSRSSSVGGGTYRPGTPSTVVPGPPEKNGPPVERTDQPNLDEYNSTAGETEHFSVVQELVGYDEDDQPIFEPRYSWRKQRMKPGPSVTIPGTPASVTAFEASNEKYANGRLVIETAEQVAAKAPNPKFSGSITGYLGFDSLTTEDRKNKGSAGDQLDAGAANGDYDSGRWKQFWLFTGVPATEDVTHSFLVKTTTGTSEEAAASYGTFTLTVKKNQTVSTEGDMEGQIPGVSLTGGVAAIQPAVPGSDGGEVKIEITHLGLLQPPLAVPPTSPAPQPSGTVRLCRWRDAFGENMQTFRPNFVRDDPDRVVVRLPVDELDPESPQVEVEVTGITGVAGITTDSSTFDMTEQSGGWESKPFLLVADSEDDSSFNGAASADGLPNDQTLVAGPGATINIKYRRKGAEGIITLKVGAVAAPRRTVNVKLHRFSETGASDAEQETQIQTCFDYSRLFYRQLGIELVKDGIITNQAYPAAIWSLVSPTNFSLNGQARTPANANPSNKNLFDYLDSLSGTDQTLHVYWIAGIGEYTGSGREPNASLGGEAELGGNTALVMMLMVNRARIVMAHEIGHCLGLDHPVQANDSEYRLMHPFVPTWRGTKEDGKRFHWTDFIFPNQ